MVVELGPLLGYSEGLPAVPESLPSVKIVAGRKILQVVDLNSSTIPQVMRSEALFQTDGGGEILEGP